MKEPKLVLDEKIIFQIEELSGRGFTHKDLASFYRVCQNTWDKFRKKHPEIDAHYDFGKAKKLARATELLWELVEDRNPAMICFYLKTQHKWSEKLKIETSEDENSKKHRPALTLTVNDPNEAARIYQQIMTGS